MVKNPANRRSRPPEAIKQINYYFKQKASSTNRHLMSIIQQRNT